MPIDTVHGVLNVWCMLTGHCKVFNVLYALDYVYTKLSIDYALFQLVF